VNDTWPKLLASNYAAFPNKKAMRYKHYGIWQGLTWEDYYLDVKFLALGLASLGFARSDRLLIVGDSAPQWYSAQIATQSLRGVVVGACPDLSATELQAVVAQTRPSLAIVQDQEQVDKLLGMESPLKKIIYWSYKGLAHYADPLLLGYREVLDRGKAAANPERFDAGITQGAADDVAALVYTSGTTGTPRAAVHTFRSLTAGADALFSLCPWSEHDEIVPAAAPAWIAGQWIMGCHLHSRSILNFPESPETNMRDTKEIEPTVVLYGARFWESQAAALNGRMLDLDGLKKIM
jgi:long-chain acyl-CoA synthetase